MSETVTHSRPDAAVWSSNLAFLIAAIGAAVGLGSLWRFPYVAGVSGGGAFLLVYAAFVALLCVPIMIAEMVIGKRGHGSAIESVRRLIRAEALSPVWKLIGVLSILIPFVGLSYYSVVAGWVTDYLLVALTQGFRGLDGPGAAARFAELTGSMWRQIALHALFIALAALVVGRGIRNGIELASKLMMPALFAILVGLVVYNLVALDFGSGVRFLFAADFSRLSTEVLLLAMGQAFYSTAIGVGVMITYSAYLPPGVSLPRSAGIICGSVMLTACLAGLAIFPIVFHFGLAPDGGPNLSFVTLPVAFGRMPGGDIVGAAFFALVFFAAFTTAIGMLEPSVAWVRDRWQTSRPRATAIVALLTWLVGLPSVLSFNVLADWRPLAAPAVLADKRFFDIVDSVIANTLLPINALLIALLVGWAVRDRETLAAAQLGGGLRYRAWRVLIGALAPAAIIAILLDTWI